MPEFTLKDLETFALLQKNSIFSRDFRKEELHRMLGLWVSELEPSEVQDWRGRQLGLAFAGDPERHIVVKAIDLDTFSWPKTNCG